MTEAVEPADLTIKLYTTTNCNFCRRAKTLLDEIGAKYEEIDLTRDPAGRKALVELTGRMSFPQIVIGDLPLGGFHELEQAAKTEQFRAQLKAQ